MLNARSGIKLWLIRLKRMYKYQLLLRPSTVLLRLQSLIIIFQMTWQSFSMIIKWCLLYIYCKTTLGVFNFRHRSESREKLRYIQTYLKDKSVKLWKQTSHQLLSTSDMTGTMSKVENLRGLQHLAAWLHRIYMFHTIDT